VGKGTQYSDRIIALNENGELLKEEGALAKAICALCVTGWDIKGRFHRLGLTPQLANPRLRDNQGLPPACVPSSSVNLTAHLTRDLTSFR